METNDVKILAIDGSADNLTALKAVLTERLPAVRVLTALDDPQGLAAARSEDPDVILVDSAAPGSDAREILWRLKKDERLKSVPVLLLTAPRSDRESRLRALEAGAEGFLVKPLDEVELTAQIRAMAKIKAANRLRRLEREELAALVVERTRELEQELAERVRTEAALRESEVRYRRAADEKALLEDQLRQAQKVEAIGRLAGGVAHDFNNLTAIVLGYGEMLLGQLPPEGPARRWVEQIVAAGRRSAALTRQLLAFSRKQTLQPEVLDLNALLVNLERMLGRLIGEDVRLELRLAADLGRISADPGQIEQVVTNLALNARDAMPRGGTLTIATADVEPDATYTLRRESVAPGKYVLLTLSDTGCGMDKAAMARLFEPFYTTKETGKGTGLGLAMVYGVVKQSGGSVWADSEPGVGTTFSISLPRTEAQPAAKAAEAGGEATTGRGERILLVEDEESLRELCATILSRLGYRVSAAGSGQEALALVEETGLAPDLVVTDVIMPGMSGPELAGRMRTKLPGLKVLYMSGYPDDAIARHGGLGQEFPFIPKPFTEQALAAKVREALGAIAPAARPGTSVLMIDDDEQFRDLAGHFCARRGHVFAGANSAAAALTALAGRAFDVLLLDLNIPGTSGELILREIRAAGHDAPAIVLTGDAASADLELLRPFGVVRVLEKSSHAEPLLQAIEAAAPR